MSKPKLLLADDSVTIRKVVELTFADEGVEVFTAGDSESAMQRFIEIQPDIVLVDVGLAGTSGYQICEMIKADEATKQIPVMLLVGSFEPFDGDEAHRVGADGFMTKPFHSIRDLVSRVSMLLGNTTNGIAEPSPVMEPAADPIPVADDLDGDVTGFEEGPPRPETADIDYLYRSSFVEGGEAQDFDSVSAMDTVDNIFDDAGMDDDMIEASYVTTHMARSETPESFADERIEQTKEFDWSPEAVVSEPVDSAPSEEKELDPSDWLEDESPLIPAVDAISEERLASDLSSFETIEFSNSPAIVSLPIAAAEEDDDDELLALFDNETSVDPAIHDTVPYTEGEQPPIIETDDGSNEVSHDLVERIVQRVIERLSDTVVRDIARVEVPRVAEKLIREALEKEKKA